MKRRSTSVLKKIWHDPVWSSVIAAILFAALSGVAALVWKPVGSLLLRTSPTPNWVLGLLGLIVASESVILLATGYTRRQLSSSAMRAHFTAPPNGAKVPRKPLLSGTVENISAGTEVWLVVETDPVYHPQKQLQFTDSSAERFKNPWSLVAPAIIIVGTNFLFTCWRLAKMFRTPSGAISEILIPPKDGLAFKNQPIAGYSQR